MSIRHKAPFTLSALALWVFGPGAAAAVAPVPPAGGLSEPSEALQRAEVAYAAGRAQLQSGNALRAMELFRAALRDNPGSIDALNGLGVALDRVGRFDLSRPQYETALALDPNSPETLHNFGLSMYLQGNHDRALPMLRKAASLANGAVRASSLALLGRMDGGQRPISPEMQAGGPGPRPEAAPQARQSPDERARLVAARAVDSGQHHVEAAAEPARHDGGRSSAEAVHQAGPAVRLALPPSKGREPDSLRQAIAVPTGDAEPLPRAPTQPPVMDLVRIGSGEWRLADATPGPEEPTRLAHVPVWTDADERAAAREEAARLAALEAKADDPAEEEGPASEQAIAPEPRPVPDRPNATVMVATPGRQSDMPGFPARRAEPAVQREALLHPLAHVLSPQPRRREDALPMVFVDTPRDIGPAHRRFEAPFQSDDPRLNAFAERMQGRGVDALGRRRAPPVNDGRDGEPDLLALAPVRMSHQRRHAVDGGLQGLDALSEAVAPAQFV